ncbi:MAG: hypothetical protein M1833_003376 [Piccolia ochrophora]|nr:MAG: hypothetical protein M1833_003376 [Piccolia ochrophora]
MFFVIFELKIPSSRTPVSTAYYTTLQKLLQTQPGFISETPFASPHSADRQVLIAQFTDEESVHRWRTEHVHLQIEKKSRDDVFDDYRLRVGPEVSSTEDEDAQKGNHVTEKTGKVVVLYERPVTQEDTTLPPRDVTELIDPARASVADDVAASLVDTSVYQGEHHVVWISAWPSTAAATAFEASIRRKEGDVVHLVHVVRDYGRFDREEAPEGADAAQAASVSEGGGGERSGAS